MTFLVSDARDLDRRIRESWQSVASTIASLTALITEAREGQVWRSLGFASWPAYVADVTSAQPVRLEREQRRELVALARKLKRLMGAHPTAVTVGQALAIAGESLDEYLGRAA